MKGKLENRQVFKSKSKCGAHRLIPCALGTGIFIIMQTAKGAKMPRGNKPAIMKYKIPVPPLVEQERIVSILDKFDALVNDISIGLPAEISARRSNMNITEGNCWIFL